MVDDTNQEMVEETIESQPEQVEEQPQQKQVAPQESFKAIREKAERMQRERDEAYRLIKEYEAQTYAKTQTSPEANADDADINLGPDDLAEGKHLTKVAKKVKYLEDQLKQYQQQSTASSAEVRLRTKYNDFESVVTQENIAQLRDQYPSIATSIGNNKDMYSAGESAYLFIKKLGIVPDASYDNDKAIAQKNAGKPRPSTSISPQQGESPLTRANAFANGLTDDLRKQLHKEMMDAMKNY